MKKNVIVYAWQFIKYDLAKSLGVSIGIVISVFLIGQQTGVYIFLTNLMSAIIDNTQSDIWVVNSKTTNANALGQMDISKLYEVRSIPGVKDAYPMVIGVGSATFKDGTTAGVQIIGSNPPVFKAGPPAWKIVSGSQKDLLSEDAVSSDVFDDKTLGNVTLGSSFEINGKHAYIALQTKGVRGFGFTYLFSTAERTRYFCNISPNKISAILVDIPPDSSAEKICATINSTIFGVHAWPSDKFAKATVKFILGTSGIGLSTFTLIIFAVIAGFFIIGLTMYSAALDRIRDYGTLKAIGATNGFVIHLIITQGIIFAISGFIVGILFLELFRKGLAKSGVIFHLSPIIMLGFLLITLIISVGGTVFAIRRIIRLEPASVFRG